MQFQLFVFEFMNYFVFGYSLENLALSKDSSQSSTSTTNAYSYYANDGVIIQNFMAHLCSHTAVDTTMWWAVDLGALYNIDSISIYNRKDCCSERLSDYSVVIYNPVVPSWSTFTADPAELCYFHPGQSPDIINLACNKKTKGRYVQIYKVGSTPLVLCEVQVFGSVGNTGARFCKAVTKIPSQLTQSLSGLTEIRCALNCFTADNCLGFILSSEGICDLYQTSQTVTTVDNAIKYYEKC